MTKAPKKWTRYYHGGYFDGQVDKSHFLGIHGVIILEGNRRAIYEWREIDGEKRVVHGYFKRIEEV
jgi:hypothetical protein